MASAPASQDSDDEIEDCPICVEPFDGDDRLFFPCQCNYKVCMFCVNRLMTEFDGRCPGCRSVYNEANFRKIEETPEDVERRKQKEREKQRKLQQSKNGPLAPAPLVHQTSIGTSAGTGMGGKAVRPGAPLQGPPGKKGILPMGGLPLNQNYQGNSDESSLAQQRSSLVNVRVVQKHVVFVLGLPLSIAKEDILRRPEHFGQYGRITKIVVGHFAPSQNRSASASAQIMYSRAEEAQQAIRGVDGRVIDGHQIRASFGTTRYCQYFLRGQQCHNPNCLFLHHEVDTDQTVSPNNGAQTLGTAGNGQTASFSERPSTGPERGWATPTKNDKTAVAAQTLTSAVMTEGAENVPEPLNGMDLSQYEKQKGSSRTTMTKSRAVGAEKTAAASPALPNGLGGNQPPSYDCALGLVADLVAGRSVMPDDLRKQFAWIAGQRSKSNQFSGLECILAGPSPIFIAPVSAAVQLKDAPEAERVVQSATTGGDLDLGPLQKDDNGGLGQGLGASNTDSKDKKLNRKGKKGLRAGGDDGY